MFTTEYGVASLSLGQIPYRAVAYIRVRTCQAHQLSLLVDECSAFCRAAGADHVFWTAADAEDEPHSCVLEMRGRPCVRQDLVESLFPVTQETVAQWRQIYNDRMKNVDHAVYLTAADEKKILSAAAYFVHHNGELLGIGWLEEDCIRAIAAVIPGAGERVLHTLLTLAPEELRLEVASGNHRAIRLYEKSGFVKTQILEKWYKK